jgi:hypothetical protein
MWLELIDNMWKNAEEIALLIEQMPAEKLD